VIALCVVGHIEDNSDTSGGDSGDGAARKICRNKIDAPRGNQRRSSRWRVGDGVRAVALSAGRIPAAARRSRRDRIAHPGTGKHPCEQSY
jgi:hypothetical protein